MSVPQVYRGINAVSAELAAVGIAKLHRNERDDYFYRSIDDVLNQLSPLLAKHKLCVLPRVLERTCTDRTGDGDLLLVNVALKVAFDIASAADGPCHTVEAFGEALDPGDKATAKAMSSAYKQAMLQLFCVPVAQVEDADRSSYRLKRKAHQREPIEGWECWSAGIIDIAASCASSEALERLQTRQRALLGTLKRERPDLYEEIGATFAKRTAALDGEGCASSRAIERGAGCTKPRTEEDGEQCAKPKCVRNGEQRAGRGADPRRTPTTRKKAKPKERVSNDAAAVPETA